jgi:hypothetical protein
MTKVPGTRRHNVVLFLVQSLCICALCLGANFGEGVAFPRRQYGVGLGEQGAVQRVVSGGSNVVNWSFKTSGYD